MDKSWRERIAQAEGRRAFLGLVRRPQFTNLDKDDARDWSHCAVGEQHSALPAVVLWAADGNPADDRLWDLGYRFDDAVQADDIAQAIRLLDAIEDRALQLKREGGTDRA